MANQNVFCNTPWYEAHIYWDGSLGICCQESRKLYNNSEKQYNIKSMSLTEWFNSQPVRSFRTELLGDQPSEICSRCYDEVAACGTSRRHRSNQKSVIFTKTAFAGSFQESPGHTHFKYSQHNDGLTTTLPIDLHIDLGNYCNLACKMCWSGASSKIASQNVKWGIQSDSQYIGNDWTKDQTSWDNLLNELLRIPKLRNIHFMGGETLLTKRFEEFVDFMILHNKFELNFSFVTNGTVFNESLVNKLKKFNRVGIEVSIETTTDHNDYIRQGTDTKLVLANIEKYLKYCNDSISVTVRTAISALTIGYYPSLLEYCLDKKLIIKSLLVTEPSYLHPAILPNDIKAQYIKNYQHLINQLDAIDINDDYNESNSNNYLKSIKVQIAQVSSLLEPTQNLDNVTELQSLVDHCRKWDAVYRFDATKLYPELNEIFGRYGY